MQSSNLIAVATAVPDTIISQTQAKAIGARAFAGKSALFERLAGVFANAGIDTRHLVAPPEWYGQEHGWAERNALYLRSTEALFVEAAGKALSTAGMTAADVDGIVTVSTTGIDPQP